jgi:hypothetical protein
MNAYTMGKLGDARCSNLGGWQAQVQSLKAMQPNDHTDKTGEEKKYDSCSYG